ncbi:hypothetical protein SAMN05444380_13315 [Thermophagus xiamenensis]|jgi:hypothetical protein|uniref:Uncharacterized protein n=1 Tax=Thermophagus xiamenensis TaxID=385682 RepID=A0A1I2FSK2_9BACT|nr:hypothetical protein SAMN05444380_13315 [Thermophagus xiamenensis]
MNIHEYIIFQSNIHGHTNFVKCRFNENKKPLLTEYQALKLINVNQREFHVQPIIFVA